MNADPELARALKADTTRTRAEYLFRHIQRLHMAARDLARDLDSADNYDRAPASDRALARYSAIARDLDSDLVRILTHDLVRNLDSDSARAFKLTLARARNLARDLSNARDLARNLANACDLARDLTSFLGLADYAVAAITTARDLAKVGAPAGVESSLERPVVRITAPAVRVAAAAARLLPAAHRARYGEEYHSELWDLATTGADRRQQIAYALRQFRCAVPLRFAVLSPRHRKAAP